MRLAPALGKDGATCTRLGRGQEAMSEKQVHAVALSDEGRGEGGMVSGPGSKGGSVKLTKKKTGPFFFNIISTTSDHLFFGLACFVITPTTHQLPCKRARRLGATEVYSIVLPSLL